MIEDLKYIIECQKNIMESQRQMISKQQQMLADMDSWKNPKNRNWMFPRDQKRFDPFPEVKKWKLGEYMKAHKISQRKMCELTGISQPTISRYIKGLYWPSVRHAKRIEEATNGNVSVDSWVET